MFIKSIINLDEKIKEKIVVLIVGTGSEFDNLRKIVKKNKAQYLIKFLGPIKHNIINDIYDISDIFVSLNTTGNFSNNCLEAFNSGICCIIPEANKNNGCDKIVSKYLKKDSLIRVPFEDMDKNLTNILANLVNNKKKIKVYSNNIKRDAKKFLFSWDLRIQKELLLIEKSINQK